jgi:hypothetical protein
MSYADEVMTDYWGDIYKSECCLAPITDDNHCECCGEPCEGVDEMEQGAIKYDLFEESYDEG